MVIPVFVEGSKNHIDGEKLVSGFIGYPGYGCVILFRDISGDQSPLPEEQQKLFCEFSVPVFQPFCGDKYGRKAAEKDVVSFHKIWSLIMSGAGAPADIPHNLVFPFFKMLILVVDQRKILLWLCAVIFQKFDSGWLLFDDAFLLCADDYRFAVYPSA